MKKHNKKTTLILTAITTIIIATITLTQATTVKAVNVDDAHSTAQAKEWYSVIYGCINKNAFQCTTAVFGGCGINDVTISATRLREGNWFADNSVIQWGSGMTTPNPNPLVEKKVMGEYQDGKFVCGDSDNKLVKTGISEELGLEYSDVICNYNNSSAVGSESWGILGQGNNNASCIDAYDDTANDDEYFRHFNTEAKSYFSEVVKNKVFSGNIPAGAMDALTPLEYYWVLYDTFTTACVQGSGHENPSNESSYQYVISEPRDGRIVRVGYSGRDNPSPDTPIQYFWNNTLSCNGLEVELNQTDLTEALKESVENGETQDTDSENTEEESNCQNSGGAGSLGWIVCSILDWMSDATEKLYDEVVEPQLKIEPTLFDDGNGTLAAWEYFRNFANIIFIIIVLFVIFSQLTGVGIDNYGIKKILPKLIVVAVLVNLSYLICLICVDLSNIIGNGVQDLFNNIPTTAQATETVTVNIDGYTSAVEIETAATDTSSGTNTAADIGIIAVGTVSAAVGAVAIYSNPALLLTLFVSVLGVLISILFVFILLAGRKAAIVLLTVLSPIAFILYMLPNTKKIFDKWLNLWKAMLLVYPICGLLIGGGNFASKLMLSAGDKSSAATIFTAMIVGIVPIFFIPTAIKGAYSAIGSIGGTLAGFGGRLRGGATKGIRGSNAYKNAQQMGLDRKTRKQAGLNKQGDATKVGRLQRRIAGTRGGRLVGADRRLNARTKAARKEMLEQEEAAATSMAIMAASEMGNTPDVKAVDGSGALTGYNLFDGKRENYYAHKFMKATEKGDRKAMNAALAAAKSAGVKDKDVAKMVRHAANSGKLSGKDNAQMSLWLQNQASANGALAKDIELQNWAAKGGAEKLGNYGEYARAHMSPSDLDKSKIGNASAESIAGLAIAGKLPTTLAKETLLDDSVNLSPDKRILLGAISEGKINTSASAIDLKRDADILSANSSAGSTNITASADEVEKWAAPAPIPVRVTMGQTTQKPSAPVPDGYKETKSGIIIPNK